MRIFGYFCDVWSQQFGYVLYAKVLYFILPINSCYKLEFKNRLKTLS